jgi:putative copper resistance protein D
MSLVAALLADSDPSGPVSIHVLLTDFQTETASLIADGVIASIALGYLFGVRALAKRKVSWPRWQSVSFLLGMLSTFIAIGSGLAAYDDSNLSMHVVQHMLLMMVGPPLLALGRPITLVAQASPRKVQTTVLKIVNSRAAVVLTSPLAWVLYYGSMWVYFVTPIYGYANVHVAFHDGSHLYFTIIGYLFWQSIVGLDGSRHRVSHPMRLVALIIGAPVEAFLGLTIMSMAKPIAPGYSLGDTHAGGSVFWITSMLIMFVAAVIAVHQWVQSENRKAARLDAEIATNAEFALSPEEEAELRRIASPGPPAARDSRR